MATSNGYNRRFTYKLQAWLDPTVLDADRIRAAAAKGGHAGISAFVRHALLSEVERLEAAADRKRRAHPETSVA